jgi:hypothetical protein
LKSYKYLAIGYLVVSAFALLFGIHIANAIGLYGLIAFFLCLGPAGALCYIAIDPPAMLLPALMVYILATALLIACLFLAARQNRIARVGGHCFAGLIWIGTGFIALIGQLYG